MRLLITILGASLFSASALAGSMPRRRYPMTIARMKATGVAARPRVSSAAAAAVVAQAQA